MMGFDSIYQLVRELGPFKSSRHSLVSSNMVASEIPLLWGIFLAEKPFWIASGQFGFSRYGNLDLKKDLSSLSAGSAWFVDTWYFLSWYGYGMLWLLL